MRVRLLFLALAVLPCHTPAAQTPTFRSGVDVVEVAVIVRDRDGRFVADLTRNDFRISEQGIPQTITAFDRVSLPAPREDAAPAAAVSSDVSTNEHSSEARVFVLLLDALHVSPAHSVTVRRSAREFIERHVAPGDLVAVLSPGAVEAATQDFTTDKARLLAAVDRFSGTTLKPASLEIAEEARSGIGALRARPFSDPSDHERARLVLALSSTLESLARHLQTIDRRRKALLLFSEGIDYNQMDVFGTVQLSSSEVTRALSRAVGALMRANVSLYAIDPRGLSSADAALVESQTHGVSRGVGGLGNSVDQEYSDSIRSLRYVSESTGGFAAVDTNEFSGAFARIVAESSQYYILGYTPSARGRPGEFREIAVRVSRPGARVSARKGYAVPAPQRRAALPQDDPWSSARVPAMPPTRPGARVDAGAAAPAPPAASEPPSGDLRTLLASPLPRPGLPLRLQAIAFRGRDRDGAVQLVVEVAGRALAFAERGDRFEERIDLAMATVDSRGKASNGRSTTLDLRLTRDEVERVRATGVRWLWQIHLPPGRYHVRVAGRAFRSGTDGLVTADVDVAPADPQRPGLSGIMISSMTSVLMITRGEPARGAALGTPPSATRTFVAGDRLVAAAEVYVPAAAAPVEVAGRVEWPDGSLTPPMSATVAGAPGRPRRETVAFPIETSTMKPGRYILRVVLNPSGRGPDRIERQVPFEIVAPSGR